MILSDFKLNGHNVVGMAKALQPAVLSFPAGVQVDQIWCHAQTQILTISVSKRKPSSLGTAPETRYLQTNGWQYNGFTHLYTQSMIQTHWCTLVKPINCLIFEWTLCLHLPVVTQFPDSEVTFNCRGKHFSLDPQTLSLSTVKGLSLWTVMIGRLVWEDVVVAWLPVTVVSLRTSNAATLQTSNTKTSCCFSNDKSQDAPNVNTGQMFWRNVFQSLWQCRENGARSIIPTCLLISRLM